MKTQKTNGVRALALLGLGVVLGVVEWWAVLYGAALAISVVTQDVGVARVAIFGTMVVVVLAGVVCAVRVREARPFFVGAVAGFVGFGLWVWSQS